MVSEAAREAVRGSKERGRQGRLDEALEHAMEAMALAPDWHAGAMRAAAVYLKEERHHEAFAAFSLASHRLTRQQSMPAVRREREEALVAHGLEVCRRKLRATLLSDLARGAWEGIPPVKGYPSTLHLSFSPAVASDDIVATTAYSCPGHIVVTEKLDGANCCICKGRVFARSHGHEADHASFSTIKALASELQARNPDAYTHLLLDGQVLVFGENMTAVHSIEYSGLTSPLYVFAALAPCTAPGGQRLWRWVGWDEVVAIAAAFRLPTVPVRFRGALPDTQGRTGSTSCLEEWMSAWAQEPSLVADTACAEARREQPEGFVVRGVHGFLNGATSATTSAFSDAHVLKFVREGHLQTGKDWRRTWKKARIRELAEHSSLSGGGVASSNEPAFFKFPRTPHILDAGGSAVTRDDLLMDPLDATRTFLNGAQVLVEEKLDGANLGIRLNAEHCLVFQNRSHTVCSETGGLWKALTSWIARHGAEVTELLLSGAEGMACETAANTTIHTSPHHPERFILFGEWLPLVHSVKYDALPGYFLPFDLYDSLTGRFTSRARLEKLLKAHTSLRAAPLLYRGPVASFNDLLNFLDQPSAFRTDGGVLEGVYLRVEEAPWLRHRAKLVRPDFIQAIDNGSCHWASRVPEKNAVRFTFFSDCDYHAQEEEEEDEPAGWGSA